MTLEETITNEENLANASSWGSGNIEQERYHRQIAEWLRELKALRELYNRSEKQACDRCIHTYGTLGCCSTVNNEWVFDCDFGQEQYQKQREVKADGKSTNSD